MDCRKHFTDTRNISRKQIPSDSDNVTRGYAGPPALLMSLIIVYYCSPTNWAGCTDVSPF